MRATDPQPRPHPNPLRAAAIAAGVCASFLPAIADPLRSSPLVAPDADALLALNARAALAADPALADLNLLVSVVDHVAVVGGPIPDAALEGRIAAVLEKLPGLTTVKVSCWVPAAEDPLREMVGRRLKTTNAPPPVDTMPPVLGIRNFAPPAHDARTPRPAETVTVQRMVPTPNMATFLLSPVPTVGTSVTPLPMPVASAAVPPATYPTIPPPAVPTTPTDPAVELAPLLANLREREPRFSGLTVALKGGTAIITGTAGGAADAWDLASALRSAAGVDRVVVGVIRRR